MTPRAPRATFRFRATIYAVGINRCVDVPLRVSRALGGRRAQPARGDIEGMPFTTTLTPRLGGAFRLFVHSRIWKALGVDRGSAVHVKISPATPPRAPAMPAELRDALARHPEAARAFAAMSAGLRREVMRWVAAAKQTATRRRRVSQGLQSIVKRHRARRQSAGD